ncbi:MAG TPA: M20/M25/M40 family metallo-hydrolase [Terriglobales bacterium]|nr:M20/M25/M40 family metallo-hydrolase [Terriglobales bacterium]
MRAFPAVSLLPLFALAAVVAAPAQGRGPMTPAQQRYRRAMETADLAIQKENRDHSQLMRNEEYLTTEIGPRLTGGPNMQAASAWTLQRFQDYGLDAHLETTQVPHAWYPGICTAELISPWDKVIPIAAEGWSKATPGAVTGPVVVLAPGETPDPAKLQGAIVLLGPPNDRNLDPAYVARNAYNSVIVPPAGVPAPGGRGGFFLGRFLAPGRPSPLAGAAVILVDSGKPWNLFSIGGAGRYAPSAIPTATISHEDYSLLYRMATDYPNNPKPMTMRVSLGGTFSPGPEDASITVAQIKGSEWPDQQVIIGGHLDSWYLGQGAVDNGTGAMSVLEAARILKSLGWQPKRTLTFILFTGEEEGGVGVQKFIADHKAEMPNVDAVLVDDTGTGRIQSISLENFPETLPALQQVYTPLQEVFGLGPITTEYFGSSDHVAFQRQGIAAYFAEQAPAYYREEHHSQADTFDKVIPSQVNQGAATIAAWMWNVSQLDQKFPHHAVAPSGR